MKYSTSLFACAVAPLALFSTRMNGMPDAGNECPAYVTYEAGDWAWDCLDDCTGSCYGYETEDHAGVSGYACGCDSAEDPDCCHIVFLPDAPRKASHAGHCGGICDPGTICWVASFTNSQGKIVYFSACI